MRATIWLLSAVIFLGPLGIPAGRAAVHLSPEGGEWHSTSTWQDGQVPPGDSDSFSIYAQAPLTLTKGSVSASGLYMYPRDRPGILNIAALANMNILNYLTTERDPSYPSSITVQGSLAVQGGTRLYGNVSFNIQGGYVFGIGRAWTFNSYQNKGAILNISDDGMLYVRQLFIDQSCIINIDKGEARFDGLVFSGGGEVHIRDGVLAAAQIDGAERGKIILGENGRLLLKGKLDAPTLHSMHPGLSVSDKTGERQLDSLTFTPGTGNLSGYTCIRLSPVD